ncbi:hypothetical protein ACR71G_21970 [Xenorhabdus bovienii]|uniref:Helix-turn-helix domain-containing protein n=1 Tax=Xenorhabdus bovienii str. kraussei Becker Underwood TaxID=1398204 RepID=A0A077PIP4_XENBV|nr:Helix-turn-helix domain-containing protein [Xenorhabdus bovienii str. kraussei Becker Underwood]
MVDPNAALCHHLLEIGSVGAKLQNAIFGFFDLRLSKNHSSMKWLQ